MTPGAVIGSLCTGHGGLDLGMLAALRGGRIAWCADPDPHIATILTTRIPDAPNLGDLRTVDWTQVEPIEVLTAGFPGQDISVAGQRAVIEKGERNGLWTEIVAALRLLQPTLLVVENVAALRGRHGGLHRVLDDLAEAGYDAIWRNLRAADIGAAHRRERLLLLGWPQRSTGMLPTPTAHDGNSNGLSAATRQGGPSLLERLLRTCSSVCFGREGLHAAAHHSGPSLPEEARRLPTPGASDAGTAGHRHGTGRRSTSAPQMLAIVDPEVLLPTPRATDGTKGAPAQQGSKGNLCRSRRSFACSSHRPRTPPPCRRRPPRGWVFNGGAR